MCSERLGLYILDLFLSKAEGYTSSDLATLQVIRQVFPSAPHKPYQPANVVTGPFAQGAIFSPPSPRLLDMADPTYQIHTPITQYRLQYFARPRPQSVAAKTTLTYPTMPKVPRYTRLRPRYNTMVPKYYLGLGKIQYQIHHQVTMLQCLVMVKR